MFKKLQLLFVLFVVASGATAPRVCRSQDMHVNTTVYNQQAEPPEVRSRSLSLFHGGKTYDFIDEVGEVVIFEAASKRFTLLNTRQMKAATVLCEELNGQLKVARETIQNDQALWNQLKFQLNPRFTEDRKEDGLLTLQGDAMRYRVKFTPIESKDKVQAYLNYADWACRLNYVLHPGKLYPEPRLALNNALRKVQALPTEVELIADIGERIHLRAEHKIYMNLNDKDRDLIHQWEKLLASKDLKHVTFQEYQKALLTEQVGRRK